jgi:hypothetical protein
MNISIPLPLATLFNKYIDKFTQFLFKETYEISHNEYLNKKIFLRIWDKIYSNIEISYDFPSLLDNSIVPQARLAIKSNISDIDKLVLRVEAISGMRFQEVLTFYNISSVPIIKNLPSIPLRTIFIVDENIFQNIKEVRVYIEEIIINGIAEPIEKNKCIDIFPPTNFDLLNMRFEKRWGSYWNLYEIDYEIDCLNKIAKRYFLKPKKFYSTNSIIPFKDKFKNILRCFIGIPIYLLFCNKFMCRIFFWSRIIFCRKKFEIRR